MHPLRKFFAHLVGAVGVVGIALFFLVFSCSQKLPTSPVAPSLTSQLDLSWLERRGGGGGKAINKDGGTVEVVVINTSDTSSLIVPSGALDRTAYIEGTGYYSDKNGVTYYSFRPDGLTFSKPIELDHRSKKIDGTLLHLWYYDSTVNKWVLEASASVKGGKVQFPIGHFSQWAVSEEGDGFGSGGQQ